MVEAAVEAAVERWAADGREGAAFETKSSGHRPTPRPMHELNGHGVRGRGKVAALIAEQERLASER